MATTRAGQMRLLALFNGYKLPSAPTRAEMARLLHGFKLPSPFQLAKLAAAVGPRDKPDEAIRDALRLHLRATIFFRRHQKDPLTELALAAGDDDLFLGAYESDATGPGLLLEMDK